MLFNSRVVSARVASNVIQLPSYSSAIHKPDTLPTGLEEQCANLLIKGGSLKTISGAFQLKAIRFHHVWFLPYQLISTDKASSEQGDSRM